MIIIIETKKFDLFSIKSYEMSKQTSMSIILNSFTQVIFDFTMIMAICEL